MPSKKSIEAADVMSLAQKVFGEIGADKAGATCN